MSNFVGRVMRVSDRWPVRVSTIVAAALLGFVIVGVWLGSLATSSVDEMALERQVRFATTSVNALRASVPRDQESVTIWDEAVERTKAGDQAWMVENAGEWMATYFGFDGAYVLNAADLPVHAMRDGLTISDALGAWKRDASAIMPMVAELRLQMASASDRLADSSEAVAELGVADYVLINGLPSIVSVKPIVGSTERVKVKPGEEYLHVAIKHLSPAIAEQFAAQYALDQAAFIAPTAAPPAAAVAVRTADGEVIAYLAWSAYRPGYQMLQSIWPIVGIVGMYGGLVIIWLLLGVWTSSKKLDDLAFRDPLTGLANRAMFDTRLRRALDRKRTGENVALLIADLDRFKNVNDSLGHPAGDELLRQVGARLRTIAAEEHDSLVARIGGDEFAVLCSGFTQPAEAQRLAAAIIAVLARPFAVNGELVFSGASVGLALVGEADNKPEELLRWADIALFESKTRGRGRYSTFSTALDEIVLQRRAIERDLRKALQTPEEIGVVYQPIFDASGAMIGAEALFRWHHPIHGDLSPSVVLGIAEERGLIAKVGAVVIGRVCQFLGETQFPWVAVNISPVQLRDPDLPNLILGTASTHRLQSSRLQLEITETALLDHDEATEGALGRLQKAGITIALDDFGTGYSSLSHLRRYRVDKIKIDRSFVARLGVSREDDAIVRAIISLARSMNRRVTAEGVETKQQQEHLAALGCHELQGFLLSKPLSRERLLELFELTGGRRSRRVTDQSSSNIAVVGMSGAGPTPKLASW